MYSLLNATIQNTFENLNLTPPIKQSLLEYMLNLCEISVEQQAVVEKKQPAYTKEEIAYACYIQFFEKKKNLDNILNHLLTQKIHHEKIMSYFADLSKNPKSSQQRSVLQDLQDFTQSALNKAHKENNKHALVKTAQSACMGYLNNLLEKNTAAQTKINTIIKEEMRKKSDTKALASLQDTLSDSTLISNLFKEYRAYICLLGKLPDILEESFSAALDKRIIYNTKESNRALNDFLKAVLPPSCPQIIAHLLRLYINASGISTSVLTPNLTVVLKEKITPFINELSKQHKKFEQETTAYLTKGEESQAASTKHARKEFLANTFNFEFEPTTMQPALLPLIDLAQDFGKLQNNVQDAIGTEGYINTLRAVFDGVNNLDNAVNNPIVTYAIQSIPQAQQLLNYYQTGKSALRYVSALFTEGASKANALYTFLQNTLVGVSSNADREKLFQKQFAFFRFYQLAQQSKLDLGYQVAFFDNYMQKIGLMADVCFEEYERFVKKFISNEPVASFKPYTLKECIQHFYRSNQHEILSASKAPLPSTGIFSNTFNLFSMLDRLQSFQEKLDICDVSDPDAISFITESLLEIQEALEAIGSSEQIQALLDQSVSSAKDLHTDTTRILESIQTESINPLITALIKKLHLLPTQDHFNAQNRKRFYPLDKKKETIIRNILAHHPIQAADINPSGPQENRAIYRLETVPEQYAANITNTLRNIFTAFQDSYLQPQEQRLKNLAALYQDKNADLQHSNNAHAEKILRLCETKQNYLNELKTLLTSDSFYKDFQKFLSNNLHLIQTITDPTKPVTLPNVSNLPSHFFSISKLVWQILPQHLANNYNPQGMFIAFIKFLEHDNAATLLNNLYEKSVEFSNTYNENNDFSLTQDLHDPCTANLEHLKEKMVETTIDAILRVRQGLGGDPIYIENQMADLIEQGLEKALAPFPVFKMIALEVFKTKEVNEKLLSLLKSAGDSLLDKAKETAFHAIGIVTARAKEALAQTYLDAPESANPASMSAFASYFLQYRSLTNAALLKDTSQETVTKTLQAKIITLLFSKYLETVTNDKERNRFISRMAHQFQIMNTTYFADNSINSAATLSTNHDTTTQIDCLIKTLKNSDSHDPMLEILISELLSQLLFGMTTTTNATKKSALEESLLTYTTEILKHFETTALPEVLKKNIELIKYRIFKTPVKNLIRELQKLQPSLQTFKEVSQPILDDSSEQMLDDTFTNENNLVINGSKDESNERSQDYQIIDLVKSEPDSLQPEQPLVEQTLPRFSKHHLGYKPGESLKGWAGRTTPLLQKVIELISLSSTTITLWTGLVKTASTLFGFTFLNISGLGLPIIASALGIAATTVITQVIRNTFKALMERKDSIAKRGWPLKIVLVIGMLLKSCVEVILRNLFMKAIASKLKSVFETIKFLKYHAERNRAAFPTQEELDSEQDIFREAEQACEDAIQLLLSSKEGTNLDILAKASTTIKTLIVQCETLKKENDARAYIEPFSTKRNQLLERLKIVNNLFKPLEAQLNLLASVVQKNPEMVLAEQEKIKENLKDCKQDANNKLVTVLSPAAYQTICQRHGIMDYSVILQNSQQKQSNEEQSQQDENNQEEMERSYDVIKISQQSKSKSRSDSSHNNASSDNQKIGLVGTSSFFYDKDMAKSGYPEDPFDNLELSNSTSIIK